MILSLIFTLVFAVLSQPIDGEGAPTVLAPGVISGVEHEAAPAFTPDGRTVIFQRSDGETSRILLSNLGKEGWGAPVIAPFSGRWSDMEPALSADGSYIVFASSRPTRDGGAPIDGYFGGQFQRGGGGNLWRVDKVAGGWSSPRRLPDRINLGTNVFAPSILADGSLLFMRSDPRTKRFRLYRSQYGSRGYGPAVPMPFSTGEQTDVDPVADRHETFIIFGSGRPPAQGIDLFIVRREGAGWGEPSHLGSVINSPKSDAEPRLSADEKILYFSSERKVEGIHESAPWNNGKYNIFELPLSSLTASPGQPLP